jgi:hypothetical protein
MKEIFQMESQANKSTSLKKSLSNYNNKYHLLKVLFKNNLEDSIIQMMSSITLMSKNDNVILSIIFLIKSTN